MGGLRGGRGGGGGGGFEEESDSFDAIDEARSDNEGCELFFGGGGGGGDESVGWVVVGGASRGMVLAPRRSLRLFEVVARAAQARCGQCSLKAEATGGGAETYVPPQRVTKMSQ